MQIHDKEAVKYLWQKMFYCYEQHWIKANKTKDLETIKNDRYIKYQIIQKKIVIEYPWYIL